MVPVLFTFDIQGVLKLKKNNSGAKRLSAVCIVALVVTVEEEPIIYIKFISVLLNCFFLSKGMKVSLLTFRSLKSTIVDIPHR